MPALRHPWLRLPQLQRSDQCSVALLANFTVDVVSKCIINNGQQMLTVIYT